MAKNGNGKKGGNGKSAKQTRIPGTERQDRNETIEKLAAAYVEVRDERMELTEREVKQKEKLLGAMKDAKLEIYHCDDTNYIVEFEEGEANVKVRKVKEKPAEATV